jgi:hypothetical protein
MPESVSSAFTCLVAQLFAKKAPAEVRGLEVAMEVDRSPHLGSSHQFRAEISHPQYYLGKRGI